MTLFVPNNLPAPLKLSQIKQHTKYFHALKKSRGKNRLLLLSLLGLFAFNVVWLIFQPQPAQAFWFDDLTGVGRAVGDAIATAGFGEIKEIYNGSPLLSYVSQVALLFAGPVVAVAAIEKLSDEKVENPIDDNTFYVALALLICFSGGGYIGGQLYLFLVQVLEGFIKNLDKTLSIYKTLESGKGLLASNGLLGADLATCKKFVGQEQVQCLAETSQKALKYLKDAEVAYGPHEWIDGRREILNKMLKDLTSSDNALLSIAKSTLFAIGSSVAEFKEAAHATLWIPAISALYTSVLAWAGLGLPFAIVGSLLVPGWGAAWVAWVAGIAGLWLFRMSYLLIMWHISSIITTTSADQFIATGWFALVSGELTPIFCGVVSGGSALAAYTGAANAIAAKAQAALQLAFQVAQLAATGAASAAGSGVSTVNLATSGAPAPAGLPGYVNGVRTD
ncbi:MAG: hypothetical protein HC852_07145 [Acaryochloridaceae cyanobacterium RU_4_10]|nr:hypothetical protein [Acaryochloridaceae cyanobacterium RU_4_10]